LYPATVDVLAVHARLTLCWGGAIPVPLAAWVAGEFVALLVKVIVEEAAPLACGVNVNVNGTVCPAAIVKGSESPETTNSGLFETTDDTVTLAPLATSDPAWACGVPTVTLPKLGVAGLAANCPGAVPVPESVTLRLDTDPSAVNARLPVTAPAAVGVSVTLNVRVCPAFSVVGTLKPLVANPAPVTLAVAI
jgi:hypothetical protein